ncbi:MAG: hypothetical protein SFV21_18135 [Rhodospirillaceae bacterium]|nr:hypothetical protein [Rhodospirillaceae bacterium]
MRQIIPHLDTLAMPWQWSQPSGPGGGGIATKVLNADAAFDARTVLLRAAPRAVNAQTRRKAHFHRGGEEFLSLGPPFSFDDGLWNPRLAYAYLPPGTVHGRDVQVPDGYLLYLRTWGSAQPLFLTEHAAPAAPAGTPVKLTNPLSSAWRTVCVLNHDPATGERALMIRLPAGFDGAVPAGDASQYEILTLEGRWRHGVDVHRAGAYACLPGQPDRPGGGAPTARVEREALLLVHALPHRGNGSDMR